MSPLTRSAASLLFAGLACSCTTPANRVAAIDPRATPTQLLAQVCSRCHGADGRSSQPGVPHLAAQQVDYIVAQLLAFRDRTRGGAVAEGSMWPVARQLTDNQIDGVAQLFAAQPAASGEPAEAAMAAAGRRIFFSGIDAKGVPPCMMCHGLRGEGFGNFPRLANQRGDYLYTQLRAFRDGHVRPPSPMSAIGPNLSDDDLAALVAYLQGMEP